MSQISNDNFDDASNGGGIGDIPRQPVNPSSQNPGNGEPVILPDDEDGVGTIEDDDLDSGDDVITVEDDEDGSARPRLRLWQRRGQNHGHTKGSCVASVDPKGAA